MSRYEQQRAKKTPPYISLKDVRHALGLTLDQVIARITEETGREYTRGFLSAIENGHRGASAQALDDIALAFGLPAGACTTNYVPRAATTEDPAA
jgi:transcriptional regulator with XRE-family HTH domain